MFSEAVNKLLKRTLNLQVKKYQAGLNEARSFVINQQSIGLVIDGGANQGQWAFPVVKLFPLLPVHSFEPYSQAFKQLCSRANQHPNWFAHNIALGEDSGRGILNIASNLGMSSSLLLPTGHLETFPGVVFEAQEDVAVSRLDDLQFLFGPRKYLKLDLQGAEQLAIRGAEKLLSEVAALEIELTLKSMYEGEETLSLMLGLLEEKGYRVFHLYTPAISAVGQCNYVDVLLTKHNA